MVAEATGTLLADLLARATGVGRPPGPDTSAEGRVRAGTDAGGARWGEWVSGVGQRHVGAGTTMEMTGIPSTTRRKSPHAADAGSSVGERRSRPDRRPRDADVLGGPPFASAAGPLEM